MHSFNGRHDMRPACYLFENEYLDLNIFKVVCLKSLSTIFEDLFFAILWNLTAYM